MNFVQIKRVNIDTIRNMAAKSRLWYSMKDMSTLRGRRADEAPEVSRHFILL